jgi:uncharacterized protein YtpQ (UPF0354 family)
MQKNPYTILLRTMKRIIPISIVSMLLLTACEGNSEWRNAESAVMPQLMESNLKKQVPGLVHQEISRDLDLGYVLDNEKGYSFIKLDALKTWEIDLSILHSTAISNLEKRISDDDIQVAEAEESANGKYAIVETGDGYDAVRLLSEKVQKRMRAHLGDEYFAAVPMRDFLIFWHKDFSLTGQFMEQVEKEYAAGEKYKLTPRLFLVSEKGLQPLTKQAIE